MIYRRIRHEVFKVLDSAATKTIAERAGNATLSFLIVANVVAVIAESVTSWEMRFKAYFDAFELLSVWAFTAEYVLRVWTCVEESRYSGLRGRLAFMASPMALLDLAVVLPTYLPGVTLDLRFIRILRLVRMLRVLKLARYSKSLRTFAKVFQEKRPDLAVVLLFLIVLVVLASSAMYMVENTAQPEQFSSIPAAMWWSVATLTTVGYGDIYPVTPVGKFIGSIIALIGIGFFALPAGLLSAAFAEEVAKVGDKQPETCPHCHKPLH